MGTLWLTSLIYWVGGLHTMVCVFLYCQRWLGIFWQFRYQLLLQNLHLAPVVVCSMILGPH
ncbi:hypothetical protein LINPERHAP1_LOCUS15145 [Linum perenne]